MTFGEQILGASALILIILSFLPLWAKTEVNLEGELEDLPGAAETSDRYSLWQSYGLFAKLAIILAIIVLVLIVMRAIGTNINLPVPAGQLYLGLAGLTLLLILISVLTGPDGNQGSTDLGFGVELEVSRGLIGLLLGTAAAAGMAFGAWTHSQQEGSAPTGTGVGGTTTPPPAS